MAREPSKGRRASRHKNGSAAPKENSLPSRSPKSALVMLCDAIRRLARLPSMFCRRRPGLSRCRPDQARFGRQGLRELHLLRTSARGSSAHAATFAKHLTERHLGIPVAAAAPNIATVYRRRLRLKHQLFLAISQSGSSDDLIEVTAAARAAGALTAVLVNDLQTPLAFACEIVLPWRRAPSLACRRPRHLWPPSGLAAVDGDLAQQ